MKLRRNSGASVRHADFHRIRLRYILAAPRGRPRRLSRGGALPDVRVGVQTDSPALGNELEGILQQIRDHTLQLRRIIGKHRQLVVREKVKRQTFFLKARRPQAAHLRQAIVQVARLEPHLQAASFQSAVGQKILNELLQPLPARLHVAEHFALPRIQRPQFLALQQFDVSIQNRQRCFQIVRRGAERVGGALESLLQFGVSLWQISRAGYSFARNRKRHGLRRALDRLGNTHVLLYSGHKGRQKRRGDALDWLREESCTKIESYPTFPFQRKIQLIYPNLPNPSPSHLLILV